MMAKQKETAKSDGVANASKKPDPVAKPVSAEAQPSAEASGVRPDSKPQEVAKVPEVRLSTAATGGDEAATRAKTDASSGPEAGPDNIISIVDDTPPPAGPALTPLERARRDPLLNWLDRRAAAIMIAAGLGALVGAMASNGLGDAIHLAAADREIVNPTEALRASVGQLAMEIASLKAAVTASAPNTPRISGLDQFKTAVSDEITGSVNAPPPSAATGWTLLRVEKGRALVQGDSGSYEVAPGSTLPGLGMVQRIMQQDGRWVVQTRGGMIAAGD
jgi:hypothetical protein